jgi:hypothetical protein
MKNSNISPIRYKHGFHKKSKKFPDILPKISIKELEYSNAQKIIDKYKKIFPICAKEYVKFHNSNYENDIDLIKITNNDIFIQYNDEVGDEIEIEVPLEEFVDFCNNYEVYVKKYNL